MADTPDDDVMLGEVVDAEWSAALARGDFDARLPEGALPDTLAEHEPATVNGVTYKVRSYYRDTHFSGRVCIWQAAAPGRRCSTGSRAELVEMLAGPWL